VPTILETFDAINVVVDFDALGMVK